MSEGWIKIHRRLIDWEWFNDINTCHLFFYLILKANYKDKSWRGILIKRGQLVTSFQSLSEAMPLSIQQIRTCLGRLKSTGEVTSKPTNKFTILTIEKYNDYQSDDEEVTSTATFNQQTNNIQSTTTKERKKERKKETKEKLPLPDWLPKQDGNDYLDMRELKNKYPTDRAKQMVITKLDKLKKQRHCPSKVLQKSIVNNWTDVFATKESKQETTRDDLIDFRDTDEYKELANGT